MDILKPIRGDLAQVERRITEELQLKEGHLSYLLALSFPDPMEKFFYPALILLLGRMGQAERSRSHLLACIFQLIYLACRVHSKVQHLSTGLTVLGGDFLYTKFFYLMGRHGLLPYLDRVATMIGRIQEAEVKRQLNQPGDEDVRAILAVEACWCGADLGPATAGKQEYAARFGWHLGKIWAFADHEAGDKKIDFGIMPKEARENLLLLPAGMERDILEGMLDWVSSRGSPVSIVL